MTAAFIRRLTLTNFRSYHAAQVQLDRAGPVVLTGANGIGKTNLVEAVSLLAPGRGLRRATMEELAFSEGDGAWAVSAEIEGMLGLARLGNCIRRSLAGSLADAGHGSPLQRAGVGAPPLSRPASARSRCAAFEPRGRARAQLAFAQSPARSLAR